MYVLLEAAEKSGGQFPVYFTAVYVIGFIAAVTIGSIAWYNSKRPPGWEESQRPNWVPDVEEPNPSSPSDSETK